MSIGLLATLLTGCSVFQEVSAPATQTLALHGQVHGGQQPIAGALVQLVQPGTTGYGSIGSIIASTTTNASGGFTLPQPYTCPANSGLVYLLATGGNAGGGINTSIAEAAVLGPCSGLSAGSTIGVTEVSTIAAAYVLAPFAGFTAGKATIGTSATNLTGLTNAAGAAGNLANLSTGAANGATSLTGLVLPTAEMNTLANILASCVNSGATGVTSTCSALFSAATPPGGTAPVDTFSAAIDIALNPGNNNATLFGLATASAPFQPALTSAPGDFAVGIQYNGGIIASSNGTHGVDIDAQGNIWFTAAGNTSNGKPRAIMELSPAGVLLSGNNGYQNGILNGPITTVVTPAGNVVVTNQGSNAVLEITSSGGTNGPFYSSPATSLNTPQGIAIDNRDGSLWITDLVSNQVTHVTSTGNEIAASSPLATGSSPIGVAVDQFGNIWVADSDTQGTGSLSAITKYTPSTGGAYTQATFSTGANTFPFDLAIDNTGNVWTAMNSGVGKYSNAGGLLSPAGGYVANSDNSPSGIAVDGLGNIWTANSGIANPNRIGSVSVVTNSGTLIATSNGGVGYYAGGILPVSLTPKDLALDGSGNLWFPGKFPSGNQAIVELIGIAAPIVTPLSVANFPNRLGVRP